MLASAVRRIGEYDLLFFGRMAIDGDTAQVGPEVAGQLDIPQITCLSAIENVSADRICVSRRVGNLTQRMEVKTPCAVMVSRENGELASPTLSGWRRAQAQEITRWSETDLGLDRSLIGLYASPTKVVTTAVPQVTKNIRWLDGGGEAFAIIQSFVQPSC